MSTTQSGSKPSIFTLLTQFQGMIGGLIVLGMIINGLTLYLPTLISSVIDAYASGAADLETLIYEFGFLAVGIFVSTGLQVVVQTLAAERVARDMRRTLSNKIAGQNYQFIEEHNPAKLLTNLTSDINSIKQFVTQAIVSVVSSLVIIFGAAGILLYTNWRLALAVLTIVPIIGIVFYLIFSKARTLFVESRTVIDSLNRVINESIIGASLIRVLNSGKSEQSKFTISNDYSRSIGYRIVNLFSLLVPAISFMASIGTLMVVTLGGYYVTTGTLSLGSFVAFISYVAILVFPILTLGFISTIISQASASYSRVAEVLVAPDQKPTGTYATPPTGLITVKNLTLTYGQKQVLKDVSFTITPGSKTAIIGPTAAGKTQLLNIIAGLTEPTSGTVLFDAIAQADYDPNAFYPHVGLVFQDSVLFNTSLRENIAFSSDVSPAAVAKAITTAELDDFIATLPQGLDTIVSERGTSLSGGQKQRIMLARALALNPTILFLDEFTARVDTKTEKNIFANLDAGYPNLTLVSITQRISAIEQYEQIIVLMEGELLASGTHRELLQTSIDYQQIYNSQRSTNA